MFRLSVSLLVIALVAAIFGFGGIAESAAFAAKIIFFIALVFIVISLLTGGFKRN